MNTKKLSGLAGIALLFCAGIVWAADHIDSPNVTNQSTDITDLYVFRGANTNNLVFVANTQGLLAPTATAAARFDANTLIEFNIDTNNDNVEDFVLQAKADGNGNMVVYGPVVPAEKGARSRLEGNVMVSVPISSYGAAPVVVTTNGISAFAGPRDDPFFFDLGRYQMILAGTAPGFNNPGTDAFAGTNVMSVVIEVPKTMFGSVASGKINVWLETKKKI